MRRRRTIRRRPAKTRHGKTTKPKRNNAPTPVRRRNSSVADLQEQVIFLARELAKAREQLAATSEILRVISSSPGELEPVFQAMLANAVRICEARFGNLYNAGQYASSPATMCLGHLPRHADAVRSIPTRMALSARRLEPSRRPTSSIWQRRDLMWNVIRR